jgi:hypothetical protein
VSIAAVGRPLFYNSSRRHATTVSIATVGMSQLAGRINSSSWRVATVPIAALGMLLQ